MVQHHIADSIMQVQFATKNFITFYSNLHRSKHVVLERSFVIIIIVFTKIIIII